MPPSTPPSRGRATSSPIPSPTPPDCRAPLLLLAHRTPGTAAGCARLRAAGAGGFEVDVQLRGSQVVVSHYLPFLRVPGWLQHDGTRFRWRSGPPHDLALTDALACVPPDALVLLDPKETNPARRARLVDALAGILPDVPAERARFRVSTGHPGDLGRYRDAGLATWRTVQSERELRSVLAAGDPPDAGVSIRHTLLSAAVVRELHARALQVVAWTVNDVARAGQLRDLGVDGVTTDSVEVLTALG